MEFHEKLQQLRKEKGLTQEELAQILFVSRTAVSKWESGRGYPNIESLKAIAKCFSVTIDALLSGDELLTIAEEENQQKQSRVRELVFGLLDISVVMFLVLPFFGQKADGGVQAVSLLRLTETTPYMRTIYLGFVFAVTLLGVLTLAVQNSQSKTWERNKGVLSVGVNVMGIVLFVLGQQPYAAIFLLVFALIKGFILLKK